MMDVQHQGTIRSSSSTSEETNVTRPLMEHVRRKRLSYLFNWMLSARFSLVIFVLCAVEGVLWLYPLYFNSMALTPPQAAEKANLQDYFLTNLAKLKHSDYKDRNFAQASEHHHRIGRSFQKELAAEFKESLKLHSPRTHSSDNSNKQDITLACLLVVVLLMLLSVLQTEKRPSKPRGRGYQKEPFYGNFQGGQLLIFGLLLLPTTALGAVSFSVNAPTDNCDLQCWLYHLTIAIPDQKFSDTFLGLHLEGDLTNLTCSQITLGDVAATIIPPTGVKLQASGVGINCAGDWAYSLPLVSDHGPLSANASTSSLDFTVMIDKTSDGLLANDTRVTACNSNIMITQLSFGNGAVGEIWYFLEQLILPLLDIALNEIVCSELTTLVNVNLTDAIQTIDKEIRPFLPPVPPQKPPHVPVGAMNFLLPPNPLIELIDYILDDVVGVDGPIGVNTLVDALTYNTGAVNVSSPCKKGGLFSYDYAIPKLGNIVIGLCAVYAEGLNTWSEFDLLRPIPDSNHSLTTHTATDELLLNVTFFLNISVSEGPLTGRTLYEEGLISTKIKDSKLSADALVALNQELFTQLSVPNDLQVPDGVCIAREVWKVNFTHLVVNFTVQDIFIIALGSNTERRIDQAISTVVGLLVSTFDEAIPALLNGVVAGPLREQANVFIQTTLDTLHNQSTHGDVKCGVPPDIADTFNEQATLISFGTTLFVFFLFALYMIIVHFIAEREKQLNADPTRSLLLQQDAAPSSSLNGEANSCNDANSKALSNTRGSGAQSLTTCLALDERLPWYVRYAVPFVIMTNIGLFASSNNSVGASVTAVLFLGDERKELPPLFSFSLANTVDDMWQAEVYALSILIALLSGGWPYLKLVLMLICWMLPTRLLSVKGREIFLMVLDALGKWSLIDAFVMVIMMTVFSLTIADPGHNGVVHIYVIPNFGFHTFIIATMLSLAITHIILAFHRRVKKLSMEEGGGEVLLPEVTETESTFSSRSNTQQHTPPPSYIDINNAEDDVRIVDDGYVGGAGKQGRRPLFMLAFSRYNKVIGAVITILLLLSMGFLIYGSIVESFRFEITGLAGIVVNFLGGSSVKSYSVIDVGLDLPNAVEDPDSLRVRWIQAAYFTLVLGVPLSTLLVLLVLWLVPMSIRVQRSIFHMTEVLHAWSSLEVYLLAIVAALLEIAQFAEFIIGDKCNLIDDILRKYFSSQLPNPSCFGIHTVLITSFWYLLGAAIIYMATGILVMWVCHRALEKHDESVAKRKSAERNLI